MTGNADSSSHGHFNDDSFFCRYFKLHTGLTPQQYRKKMTGG